jgi:hypothetical protein
MSTPAVNNHFHFYGKLGACAEDEDREKEGVDFDKKLDHMAKLGALLIFVQGRRLAGSAVYFLNQNKATLII